VVLLPLWRYQDTASADARAFGLALTRDYEHDNARTTSKECH
jgi:hypothetical protein